MEIPKGSSPRKRLTFLSIGYRFFRKELEMGRSLEWIGKITNLSKQTHEEDVVKKTFEEILKDVAVKEFKKHWNSILKNVKEGRLSKTYYVPFQADTTVKKKYLANKFYGLKHATHMALLSDKQIKTKLATYLPFAIPYVMGNVYYDKENQKEEIKAMVKGEYVLLLSRNKDYLNVGSSLEEWRGSDVHGYPDDGYALNWFDSEAEVMRSGDFMLVKSTGEVLSIGV